MLLELLQAGLGNLAAYLAAHVLLCLLPAFFIAGAMTALIPKQSVTRWLGRTAPHYVSYPAAALAGSLLAVCSCTIVPLFAGIHRKGAGLGPAITFLFFAPAGNIMALSYTGTVLGAEFAIARLLLCLIFGLGIGMLMALIFWRDDARHDAESDAFFSAGEQISKPALGLLLALLAVLLAGTLQIDVLNAVWASFSLPWRGAAEWQAQLLAWVPFDASKGEEGVSVQGSVLIGLLFLIAASAWRGLGRICDGATRWTWLALGAAAATLLLAALRLSPQADALQLNLTGRLPAVAVALLAVWGCARRLPADAWQAWLWESWRFVRQIFPLLVVGVFVVGIARQLIRPEWIEALAGQNDLAGNAVAVGFGVFMYFPTLVEVPIAKMFLSLGMHPGPLLAYLMADPELSLQSILMVAAIIGRRKAAAYVVLVATFSIMAGLLYGAWVDGQVPVGVLLSGASLLLLGGLGWRSWSRRNQAASF